MILTYQLFCFDHLKEILNFILNLFLFLLCSRYADVCWKTNWEKFLVIDFHISVTQCKRKCTAFANKLLQTQTKSIIFINCNLQQKAFHYRLWLFDWYLTEYAFNSFPR